MLVIFNSPTIGTVLVNVVRISARSFTCGNSTSNEPPSKSFEEGRNRLTFPDLVKDIGSVLTYASGALVRKMMYLLIS